MLTIAFIISLVLAALTGLVSFYVILHLMIVSYGGFMRGDKLKNSYRNILGEKKKKATTAIKLLTTKKEVGQRRMKGRTAKSNAATKQKAWNWVRILFGVRNFIDRRQNCCKPRPPPSFAPNISPSFACIIHRTLSLVSLIRNYMA